MSLNHKKKKKKISTNKKNRVLDHPICPGFDYDMYYLWKKKKKKTDGEMVVTGDKTPFIMSLLKLYYILLSFIFCGISSISLSIMANMVVEKPAPPTYS